MGVYAYIEQKQFGMVKLLTGCATLYRMRDVGGCCCASHATSGLILRLYVDYAEEVSVGREHDPFDQRVVAWVWELWAYVFSKEIDECS